MITNETSSLYNIHIMTSSASWLSAREVPGSKSNLIEDSSTLGGRLEDWGLSFLSRRHGTSASHLTFPLSSWNPRAAHLVWVATTVGQAASPSSVFYFFIIVSFHLSLFGYGVIGVRGPFPLLTLFHANKFMLREDLIPRRVYLTTGVNERKFKERTLRGGTSVA